MSENIIFLECWFQHAVQFCLLLLWARVVGWFRFRCCVLQWSLDRAQTRERRLGVKRPQSLRLVVHMYNSYWQSTRFRKCDNFCLFLLKLVVLLGKTCLQQYNTHICLVLGIVHIYCYWQWTVSCSTSFHKVDTPRPRQQNRKEMYVFREAEYIDLWK